MKIYDVCNDYSLELIEGATAQPTGYSWTKNVTIGGVDVFVGFSHKVKEVHYVATYETRDISGDYL